MNDPGESERGGGASRPPVEFGPPQGPPPPPPGYAPAVYPPPAPAAAPRRRGAGGIIGWVMSSLLGTVLVFSLFLNAYFFVFFVSMRMGPTEEVYIEGDGGQRIVVLPIEGLIDDGTAAFVHDALQALRDNPPKAIILRVDSGGGYVTPSDQIWKRIDDFKRKTGIPIVASFGSTAASGGYYVAASADAIVAEPTCITGSIGVIAQAFTFNGLLDKVGVTPEVITSTDSTRKDLLNPMRPWTEQDRQKLRSVLDSAYERFVQVVHQGRQQVVPGLTLEEVRQVATGEFFTVADAIRLKLVDQEGYLIDAVEAAKARAGLAPGTQPQVSWMHRPRPFGLGGLLGSSSDASFSDITGKELRSWMLELGTPTMLYAGARR